MGSKQKKLDQSNIDIDKLHDVEQKLENVGTGYFHLLMGH